MAANTAVPPTVTFRLPGCESMTGGRKRSITVSIAMPLARPPNELLAQTRYWVALSASVRGGVV